MAINPVEGTQPHPAPGKGPFTTFQKAVTAAQVEAPAAFNAWSKGAKDDPAVGAFGKAVYDAAQAAQAMPGAQPVVPWSSAYSGVAPYTAADGTVGVPTGCVSGAWAGLKAVPSATVDKEGNLTFPSAHSFGEALREIGVDVPDEGTFTQVIGAMPHGDSYNAVGKTLGDFANQSGLTEAAQSGSFGDWSPIPSE